MKQRQNMDTPKTAPRSRHSSSMAEQVARKVIEKVRKGEKPSIRAIAPTVGYSPSMRNHAEKITRTRAYQNTVRSFVEQLEEERQRVLDAMRSKDLSEESYKTLSESLARNTHDVQLLTGNATERHSYDGERAKIALLIAGLTANTPADLILPAGR